MFAQLVSIVVPAFNPAPGWSQLLLQQWKDLQDAIPDQQLELILVNDGSSTPSFAAEADTLIREIPSLRLLQHSSNRGKGAALRTGVGATNTSLILVTDVDFPYTTISMVATLAAVAGNGADIAAGSRNEQYYNKVPWLRSVLSRFLRWLIRKRLQLPFDDTQCGLKAMNTKGRALFLQTKTERYLYDLEFIVKAASIRSLNIQPVPVQLRQGIVLRRMSPRILLQEAGNFLNILLHRNRL